MDILTSFIHPSLNVSAINSKNAANSVVNFPCQSIFTPSKQYSEKCEFMMTIKSKRASNSSSSSALFFSHTGESESTAVLHSINFYDALILILPENTEMHSATMTFNFMGFTVCRLFGGSCAIMIIYISKSISISQKERENCFQNIAAQFTGCAHVKYFNLPIAISALHPRNPENSFSEGRKLSDSHFRDSESCIVICRAWKLEYFWG